MRQPDFDPTRYWVHHHYQSEDSQFIDYRLITKDFGARAAQALQSFYFAHTEFNSTETSHTELRQNELIAIMQDLWPLLDKAKIDPYALIDAAPIKQF